MLPFNNSTDISTEIDGPDSIQDAVTSTGALTESYINVTSPTKLSNLTLVDTFERHARAFPNKDAFVVVDIDLNQRECLTFKEWNRQSDNLAASLIRLGLTNGDAVAMVIHNRIEHPVAWMAALKANLVPCFLSLSRKSGDDLKLSLNDLEARAVIICRLKDHINREFNEVTRRVFETFCTSKYDADLPYVKSIICIGETLKGTSDFNNLIEDVMREDTDALSKRKALITAESICAVYQTSGTTGKPKHVVHRHFGIVNSYRFIAKRKRINAEDRYFSDLPMSWGAGLAGLFHCMVTGSTTVTIDPIHSVAQGASTIETILRVISREKCTRGVLAPYMLRDMVNVKSYEHLQLDKFMNAWTGTQRVPRSLLEEVKVKLPTLGVTMWYGTTETSFISGQFCKDDATRDIIEAQIGSSGFPLPYTEVKIVTDDDSILPINTLGNIKVKSPRMFTCYFGNSDATKEKIQNGWYDVGDLGSMNARGCITVQGRRKEFIKRGTILVSPKSIEETILAHPAVEKALAIAVPDQRLGQEICACVYLKDGQSASEDDLITFCKDTSKELKRLDGLFPVPKHVVILDKWHVLSNGKPNVSEIKDIAFKVLNINACTN